MTRPRFLFDPEDGMADPDLWAVYELPAERHIGCVLQLDDRTWSGFSEAVTDATCGEGVHGFTCRRDAAQALLAMMPTAAATQFPNEPRSNA